MRRRFNEVAAAIDTLVRHVGAEQLARVTEGGQPLDAVPPQMDLVLIFWADDEAEVTLNGYPLGGTRLTPTRIEIPALYLAPRNRLRVHCWDTDRVESGFMAGLYLQDASGGLRPVLLTGERGWFSADGPAQTLYYSHSQPDIPGAQVVWGSDLFGQVRLEAEFSTASLRQAAAATARPEPEGLVDKPMDMQEAVSRLVRLQERRGELARDLKSYRAGRHWPRWEGTPTGGLTYTLGKAAPLEELESLAVAQQLHDWARVLPVRHSQLIFQPGRPLKGLEAATEPAAHFEGEEAAADRRADYQPPPERGPGEARQSAGAASSASVRIAQLRQRQQARLWSIAASVLLTAYIGIIGRRWWVVFGALPAAASHVSRKGLAH